MFADILFLAGQAIPAILAVYITYKKRYALPALISGVLAAIAFPPCEFYVFAWVALVPWLYSLPKLNTKQLLMSNLIFNLTFFGIGISWMATVHPLSPIAILFPLYFIILPFPILYAHFSKNFMPMWLAAPIVWVANDYLRCYIFTGFPWLYMGHTLAYETTLIQFADITGAYGVTFLVVLANGVIANWVVEKQTRPRHLYVGTAVLLLFLVGAYIYGAKKVQLPYTEGPKVACIQGNIPQDIKDNVTQLRSKVFNTYTSLTLRALEQKPDLLVWPETMAPGDCNLSPESWQIFNDLSSNNNVNLLIGSHRYLLDSGRKTFFTHNSAYFFNRLGNIEGHYDKIRLVPVGESIPFSSYIPFVPALVYILVGYVPDLKPGTTRPVFTLDDKYKFGSLVCFDIIYPDETRILAKKGCQFVVNVTNEGWFALSSEIEQITANSIFRAIENRVGVLRVGNSGVTLAIPPTGKLNAKYIHNKPIEEYWQSLPSYMQQRWEDRFLINWHYLPQCLWGQGSFVSSIKDSWDLELEGKRVKWKDFPGFFVTNIPIKNTQQLTVYTKYGDWLPQFLSIITMILAGISVYRLYQKKG
ncbi:apolipoprotein N-acyltransferase [Candidatus Uabimicrobium amorphum]|uniref:Apolipoprotein N-acyltransferase n=1 Tax=Uabimicrobium amorphum TaxID=2596890 RepID=A0A5S9F4S0_UABAM|nr:apolipoprotein N-acyltransferase [Candidatus Uabimicrobium amorphum]BBM86075.1 apolipoprotein N-acyltransferase [Candidatus Uabimicrobium amorphum]